jgi:hypothetical protein
MKKFYLFALSAALCSSAIAQVNVTFEVDMNGTTVSPNGVHLAGNFNDPNYDGTPENAAYTNWSPSSIALDDSDMDGVYSTTLQLVDSRYEFKFVNDNDWPGAEDVPPTCQVEVAGNDNREMWVAGSDMTYHVVFGSCGPAGTKTIRFRVDMTMEPAISPDGIHVAGQFQGWDPAGSELKEKAAGIYEGYFTFDPVAAGIPNGTDIEFKYINGDDWTENSIIENMAGESCGLSNENRLEIVTETNTVLPVYCFNACSPCVAPTLVTFQVDMSLETVSPNGVHVAGNFQGWSPGDPNYEMTDDNADNIYELTTPVQPGTYSYKFINGNDWSGADNDNESLPAECNVGGNRELVVGTEAITVTYCYNQCGSECIANPDPANITFRVNTMDMDPQPTAMFMIGNFTEPQWQSGAVTMTDDDGDMIYEATVTVDGPAEIQYKFMKDDVSVNSNEENGIADCGVDNGVGGYNRVHVRSGSPEVLPIVCFNECQDCVINVSELETFSSVSIFPVPADNQLTVSLNSVVSQRVEIRLINALGQVSYSLPLGIVNGQFVKTLDVSALSSGVYTMVISSDAGSYNRMIEIK